MATTTAEHFEPTTDTFGQLTLHARHKVRALPINLLIALAFLSAIILAITGIVMADSAMFTHYHAQTVYYGGVPLDYD
ncbi:hypothetical protein [Asticcacaulis benevestitus]|uniref:Uncharacterized protein n=1 Tax=Asticcacaulis benevestitus DSM 16100 = ATCC BAA-896 TaxID=1121022 RepID=V4PJV9_9CAUL|nr:hypothetical protein [Asticcacaulis benevestitus]ESQ94247.1 hypothetical protein ABENE_01685 [Asticcacaulis benevestitus DSM 16100 = ATCC BAA-896]